MNSHSHDSVHELIARVVEEQRGSYRLLSEDTEYLAELAGRLRRRAGARAELPAVGDWVRAVTGTPAPAERSYTKCCRAGAVSRAPRPATRPRSRCWRRTWTSRSSSRP